MIFSFSFLIYFFIMKMSKLSVPKIGEVICVFNLKNGSRILEKSVLRNILKGVKKSETNVRGGICNS